MAWTRVGFGYETYIGVYRQGTTGKIEKLGQITRRYGFVSYHLIRLFRGQEELERLAKLPPKCVEGFEYDVC